jgi:hypothetical protein
MLFISQMMRVAFATADKAPIPDATAPSANTAPRVSE